MNVTKHREYILVGIIISILIHVMMVFMIRSAKYDYSDFVKPIPKDFQFAKPPFKDVQAKDSSKIKDKKKIIIPPMPVYQEKKTAYLTPGSPVWFKNNAPAVAQKAPDNRTNNITGKMEMPLESEAKISEKTSSTDFKKNMLANSIADENKTDENKTIEQSVEKQQPQEEQKSLLKKIETAQNRLTKVIQKADPEPSKQTTSSIEKAIIQPLNQAAEVSTQSKSLEKSNISKSSTLQKSTSQKKSANGFSLKGLQIGFTEFLRQGNNDIMHREGDRTINPTPEDLKLMSYYRQINSALENAINFVGKLNTRHLSPVPNIVYQLIIERDGSISHYSLLQKSKYTELNDHALKVLKNLGSLPPLPHYITAPHLYRAVFLYFYDPVAYHR